MALNSNNMASEIIAAIGTLSDADRRNQQKVWEKVCGAMVAHIVTNMGIKGITVDTGTLHAASVPTVTPNDGGSTLYSSQLKGDINSQTLTQNNDGTGRVE